MLRCGSSSKNPSVNQSGLAVRHVGRDLRCASQSFAVTGRASSGCRAPPASSVQGVARASPDGEHEGRVRARQRDRRYGSHTPPAAPIAARPRSVACARMTSVVEASKLLESSRIDAVRLPPCTQPRRPMKRPRASSPGPPCTSAEVGKPHISPCPCSSQGAAARFVSRRHRRAPGHSRAHRRRERQSATVRIEAAHRPASHWAAVAKRTSGPEMSLRPPPISISMAPTTATRAPQADRTSARLIAAAATLVEAPPPLPHAGTSASSSPFFTGRRSPSSILGDLW